MCLSVCLSCCLSVRLSVRRSVRPFSLSSVPFVRLFVCSTVCLSALPSVCLSVCLSVRPSVRLSFGLPICLFVCLSIFRNVCLYVRLPAYQCPTKSVGPFSSYKTHATHNSCIRSDDELMFGMSIYENFTVANLHYQSADETKSSYKRPPPPSYHLLISQSVCLVPTVSLFVNPERTNVI